MNVLFVGADGRTKCHFFCTKDVADAMAPGIKAVLEKAFDKLNWRSRLVSLWVDGAAVNLGVWRGVLREDLPWLVAIHCLNHRLELAAKNAFVIWMSFPHC